MGVVQFVEHLNESCQNKPKKRTRKKEWFTGQKTTARNGHRRGYNRFLDKRHRNFMGGLEILHRCCITEGLHIGMSSCISNVYSVMLQNEINIRPPSSTEEYEPIRCCLKNKRPT